MKSTSRIVLGTVQLGMEYGVNNTQGQPRLEESLRILESARAGGITTFDTASAYGTSEEVLGKWIEEREVGEEVSIISKLKPHFTSEYPATKPVGEIVRSEIQKSLERLHLSQIDGYLLHTPEYLSRDDVLEAMQEQKRSGLVKNIGVSIYDEKDALEALSRGVDYIQVPYNALDQRLDRTRFFEEAKKKNVKVFARSPFLQGLLLMDVATIPKYLSEARNPLQKFIDIAQSHGLSQLEATLVFALEKGQADHIVLGANSAAQLQEVMETAATISTNTHEAFIAEIVENFKDVDAATVDPRLWKKA